MTARDDDELAAAIARVKSGNLTRADLEGWLEELWRKIGTLDPADALVGPLHDEICRVEGELERLTEKENLEDPDAG